MVTIVHDLTFSEERYSCMSNLQPFMTPLYPRDMVLDLVITSSLECSHSVFTTCLMVNKQTRVVLLCDSSCGGGGGGIRTDRTTGLQHDGVLVEQFDLWNSL